MPKSKRRPSATGTEIKRSLQDGPKDWQGLKAEFPAGKPLRLLLNGMERNGEIQRDHHGFYHLADPGETFTGVIEQRGGALLVEGLPIEKRRRNRLRPGDRVAAKRHEDEARIVKIIEYASTPLIGVLQSRARYPYVESISPEYRGRVSVSKVPVEAADGDTVKVTISGEDRRGLVGQVSEVLVKASTIDQAAATTLAAHSVPLDWAAGVEEAAAALPQSIDAEAYRDREDLTDLPLVTIDGETAKDFDDAVFAEPVDGGWRLLVAIADVAHYVTPGSALDDSAWQRGTSVYLPDRVVPMLPEALSNHLCSLKPDEPRLALVCEMRISSAGEVTGHRFSEGVIRSWQRLTYTEVAGFLDGGKLAVDPAVTDSLAALHDVYKAFDKARVRRGGLDFETREGVLALENGRVKAITPVVRNDAHRLIEEAMIAANVCAALFLEAHDQPALYRVHEGPNPEKAEQLASAFAFAGVKWRQSESVTPKSIQQALASVAGGPNGWLVAMMVLRSMQQATYTPANNGHFGLALERYMHFTSPIRRYPDLVVHRAIKHVLRGRPGPAATMEWLVATGEQTSMTERRAEQVGWAVDAWLKCEFLSPRVGETLPGVIAAVTDFGLFVELHDYYVQGLLHVSELGGDYFQYRPASMSMVGERSGQRFALGDELIVRLTGVQPELGRLDLELVSKASTKRVPRKRSGQKRADSKPPSKKRRRR